jgi:hypothetical protein
MVLVDTLVSGVRDPWHVECCSDSRQFGEGIDLHLPHNRPRWAFTVISLVSSLAAICLFNRPETTQCHSSRSRGVSDA